jgi:hypothetical protein
VSEAGGYRFEIAHLDRHTAEALRLELERFARAEGITLTSSVERAEPAPGSD